MTVLIPTDVRPELHAQQASARQRIASLKERRRSTERQLERIETMLQEISQRLDAIDDTRTTYERRTYRTVVRRDKTWKQHLRHQPHVSAHDDRRAQRITQQRQDRQRLQKLTELLETEAQQYCVLQQQRAELRRRISTITEIVRDHEGRISALERRKQQFELQLLQHFQVPKIYRDEGDYVIQTTYLSTNGATETQYDVYLAQVGGTPFGRHHGHIVGIARLDGSFTITYARLPGVPHGAHNYRSHHATKTGS